MQNFSGSRIQKKRKKTVCDDSFFVVDGVDHARSFEIIGNHAADFSAGAEANYAANGGVGVAEWIMPEDGTIG